jgi:hypothetical protein
MLIYYKLVVLVNAWEVGRIIYVGSLDRQRLRVMD